MLFVDLQHSSYRQPMTTARKPLTPDQMADAARLMAIWERKKKSAKLSQESVAQSCGWSSNSAFSQYLHGKVALNLEAVLKLSRIFGVSPKEISPSLASLLPGARLSPKALAVANLYEECPEAGRDQLLSMITKWVRAELIDEKQKTET